MSNGRVISAIEARKKAGIVSLKQESHTSHCNQAFDQMVAKNDKKVAAETLAKQRIMMNLLHKANSLTQ